jgi:hypothetical protein
MEEKKLNIILDFNFYCIECKYDFTLSLESEDGFKPIQEKVFCHKCGKESKLLGHKSVNIITDRKRAHQNEMVNRETLRMANEQKMLDNQSGNRLIPVTSTQEGKNKGKTELIPESVIRSIDEKLSPELLEE